VQTDDRFKHLTYHGFRALARDPGLSGYEKIGFPDSYRRGKAGVILRDIAAKLGNLKKRRQIVLDIGPGCSDLATRLIGLCRRQQHKLLLVDSREMLDQLPDARFITKIPAYYPDECPGLFRRYAGKVNAILAYSLLHYVYAEGQVFKFLDCSLELLAAGGELLLGDIPNISKRKRFFSSPAGIRFHHKFSGGTGPPPKVSRAAERTQINDVVLAALIGHARRRGCDAYWLPQGNDLPMANRREDILIRRP
jgi:hypothetical protein